ncbi:MAG TPA: amidohydrolase family protein [Gemmatimonadaceae bacterium]|nr:amidohydrolase family protein [Gemmatimonadaceae bacterium]
MRITVRFSLAAMTIAATAFPVTSIAQRADSASRPGRGAELPLEPSRTVRFTTDEGTWMSLDLSPDGRTLVFDLVGDVYTLPVSGGKATRVTDGLPFDAQPRWSPDGKHIVFVSDRDGSDDVWIMDADGKNARQITRTDRTQFVSPDFTPDGKYIVVSRNAVQYGTQYNLYLYHRDGGTGVRMTGVTASGAAGGAPPAPGGPGGAQQRNYVGAAFGADSRYIYAASRNGGAAGYNQTGFDWTIVAYDRETGETTPRAAAVGGAFKPVLSPDGKWMVYGTRQDSVTSLRIRDMESGDEHWLVENVQRDDMESRFTRDILPNMTFTPDSRSLIAAWGGKIRRVDIPSGQAAEIPFTADVETPLGALAKFDYPINDSTITVAQIRGARPSPDGRRLAFTALDKLWVMDLPAGTPRRLTRSPHETGEHSPVWSPDGRYLTYITWSNQGGDIHRVAAGNANATPERLTRQSAFYSAVNYTPNGQRLVAYKSPRQPRLEEGFQYGRELVWLPAAGGVTTSVSPVPGNAGFPHFTRDDNERIYMAQGNAGLVSVRFDGTDRKTHIRVTGALDHRQQTPRPQTADEILVSPSGDRVLASVDDNVYVMDIPVVGGQTPTVSVANLAQAVVPVRRLTRIGGDFIGWHPDGNRAHFSIGRSYFTYDFPRADSLVRDSTVRADAARRVAGGAQRDSNAASDTSRSRPAYEPARLDVAITVPKDRPSGQVVLRNARVITMKGDEVIERADVLVRNNRIAAVGPAGTVQVPNGTREIDVTGKTILPGFVDTHAHMWPDFGIHRSQVWMYMANLAYGVTATRDPQTATTDVLSYGDLVETGDILGPRIFSTGPGVFWYLDIKSLADARDVLRRYSEFYKTNTIKQYMVGDRKVRQWVITAARELGLSPTLEGGLDAKKNLTEAIDGYAGIEHSLPIAPLFKDNVQLLAESGTVYTPTLLVLYGGPFAENYWYASYDILEDEKLGRFTPKSELLARGLRRPGWWHPSQYAHSLIAAQAKKIMEAGGRVGVGSHGQLQGLGYHWEMWNIASGGATPMQVLKAATVHGADAIGHGKDLGSIEAGKLADLVVLDANPLADIRNTNTLRYVMKNGRLYDANTLNEVWPRQRVMAKQWWMDEDPSSAAPSGGNQN